MAVNEIVSHEKFQRNTLCITGKTSITATNVTLTNVFLYSKTHLFFFFFLSSDKATVVGLSTVHRHTHMGVRVAASSAVHVQDARVQRLLVVQRKGHGVQTASPILPTRLLQHSAQYVEMRTEFWRVASFPGACRTYGNGLEQNPSSSHVLILQELLGLLPLLF